MCHPQKRDKGYFSKTFLLANNHTCKLSVFINAFCGAQVHGVHLNPMGVCGYAPLNGGGGGMAISVEVLVSLHCDLMAKWNGQTMEDPVFIHSHWTFAGFGNLASWEAKNCKSKHIICKAPAIRAEQITHLLHI